MEDAAVSGSRISAFKARSSAMRPSMMRPVIIDRRVSLRREPASWRSLAGFLAIVFIVAVLGSLASPGMSPGAEAWYVTLRKPSWTPPNALFSIVWPVLYTMMAIAAWLIWRARSRRSVQRALQLFSAQLALNAIWSPVYFGLKSPGAALIVLVALVVTLVFTIRAFARIHRPAAALLAPYLAWVLFAGALNTSIWLLNR